jgi:hypothetical protein
MTRSRRISSLRAVAAALAASALLLVLAVDPASAYTKPPGGTWTFEDLFDATDGGSFALSRDGSKVAKLVLKPGEDSVDACGSGAIRLLSRPQVRSYRSVNGRYAVAKIRGGLFVPTSVSFKVGGRSVDGKLELLWGETGRVVETGKVELGDCRLSFYARKSG